MYTNVNFAAPLGAMAFLGTGLLLAVTAVVLIQSLVVRKLRRARTVLIVLLAIAGAYLAAIMAFSLVSHSRLLARGEEKHFCELDCHLAYSVANVRQVKNLGNAPSQITAHGVYTIVTIKPRFDETTIAPWRGDGLLYPNGRVLTIVDDRGNRYGPSPQGQRALDSSQGSGTPLTTPLRPTESYTSDIVFDLPPEAKAGTLLINEGDWITRLIIGHENSPLHGRTSFEIKSFAG